MAHLPTRLLTAGLVLAGLAAQPAAAGTFHVYGLGMNGAGCPNGWQAQASPSARFSHSNQCSHWEIRSVRDGTALKQGDSVGTSMYAGTGSRFTGFSIRTHGTARNGTYWNAAMCTTPFANCQTHFPKTGTWNEAEVALGNLAPGGSAFNAQHLWVGAKCAESSCPDSTSAGRAVNVTHLQSHAIVDDYTAPGQPSIGGVSSSWNSGEKQLSYSASDAGSGVESVTLTVDGSLHRTVSHSCSRLPTGGFTRPVPCALATSGEFAVNQPGQLADGKHTLTVGVHDAGLSWGAATQEFWVDNNAPGHPLGLAVVDGDGWRGSNDFAVTWENPDQGSGSGIAAAYYKVGSAPTSPTDGTRVSGVGLTELEELSVPRDGQWTLFLWLRDEADNADHEERGGSQAPPRLHTSLTRLRQ